MRLSVEMMVLYVGGDGGGEEVGAGIALMKALADDGGGDVFVECEQEMDSGLLRGRQGEGCEGRMIFEGEAGAADDDPFG